MFQNAITKVRERLTTGDELGIILPTSHLVCLRVDCSVTRAFQLDERLRFTFFFFLKFFLFSSPQNSWAHPVYFDRKYGLSLCRKQMLNTAKQ